MTQHISDDLPRLLTGDASRDETMAAATHLRECPDCQQELVSAVVAHAALSSAHRVASAREPVVAPTDAEQPALPDMSAVFAKVRDEAAAGPTAPPRRRRWLVAAAAAAAAAVVATAGGITIAETVGNSPSAPTAATTIRLEPLFGGAGGSATVIVTGEHMHLDATSLPTLDAGHQYEVWLVADSQLRPLGYIGGDRTADLTVPAPVMAQYDSVAISLQRNNQVEFSGDVVVRGSYA